MKEYPYFESVPQDLFENLTWRLKVRERAKNDKVFQKSLIKMSRDDILFWFSGFCYLYEPRPRRDSAGRVLPTIVPFIPWPHQIPVVKLIDEALGFEDIGAEKSRGEGASWMACLFSMHRWLFFDTMAIGMVSRNEAACDSPDDPDSMFWKLDFTLERLPIWMAGEMGKDWTRSIAKHVLRNLRNGSTISGYAATGDVASGGRKTFFVMDELAKFPRGPDQEALDSTGPVTDSRFIISTPKGAEGAYYSVMHSDVAMVRVVLDWKDNPTRNRGLFRIHKTLNQMLGYRGYVAAPVDVEKYGNPDPVWLKEFYDKDLKRLGDRGFAVTDKEKVWSQWYVKQCLRPGATPQSIAQEYDRDYGGSMSRFFNAAMIDRLIVDTTKPALYTGDLHFDSSAFFKATFDPNPVGYFKVWCNLINEQYPGKNTDYVVGVDIASGQGGVQSSNSVISVVDRQNGVKVAEFASPITPPEALANYAVAICLFFGGKNGQATMIWEDNGYGAAFRNRIFETNFRNFYYRSVTDETSRRKTKKPGWSTNRKTKRELLGQYSYSLGEGLFTNPSRPALNECKDYMLLPGGRIDHVSAANSEDPAGAGENHGDRVIADALCNWLLYEQREGRRETPSRLEERSDRIPPTSILALRKELNKKKEKVWW